MRDEMLISLKVNSLCFSFKFFNVATDQIFNFSTARNFVRNRMQLHMFIVQKFVKRTSKFPSKLNISYNVWCRFIPK